jgi:large subunit ribosomal protein L4
MKWDVTNIDGEKIKSIELPEAIFGVEMNEGVIHSVIKAYQANKRQGTHATKTRSLVSGGGKKPFRQKGTGGARQGSSRSPLNPGGGTAHGPQPRDYRQHINKKTKQLALKIALSDKVRHNKLFLVDDFGINSYNTKQIVKSLQVLSKGEAARTTLLADERKDDFLYKSTRNIHGAMTLDPAAINAENILRYEALILSETALAALHQRLQGEEN